MTVARSSILRVAGWLCVVLLAILSLLPAEEMVRTNLGGHVEHAMAYAGTAALMRLGYRDWKWTYLVVSLVSYAGVLELLQHLSPGRHPAVDDWLASSAGALLGVAAMEIVLLL